MDKITFFNKMAVDWDWKFYTDEKILHIRNVVSEFHLTESATILDAGTGTGGIIPFILEQIGQKGHVEAIDYAEEMIKIAKEKFSNENRVRFHQCDVANTPFKDEFFDYVICFGLFPHIEDKAKALYEINRILKDKGRIIIAHALSSDELKSHHLRCDVVKDDLLSDESEIMMLLEDAGFQSIRLIDRQGMYLCEGIKIRGVI